MMFADEELPPPGGDDSQDSAIKQKTPHLRVVK